MFRKWQLASIANAIRLCAISLRTKIIHGAVVCAAAAIIAATMTTSSSSPSSGTLTDLNPLLTYTAGPFNVANATPLPEGVDAGPRCNNPSQPCDDFALTVTLPAGYVAAHPNVGAKVTASWTDTASSAPGGCASTPTHTCNSYYYLDIYRVTVHNTP